MNPPPMDPEGGPQNADESALGKRKRSEERRDARSLVRALDQDEVLAPRSAIVGHHMQDPIVATKKQRLGTPAGTPNISQTEVRNQRPRLNHTTILPPEILQHIFSYVDPHSLARLMVVCQAFSILIDPSKTLPPSQTARTHLRLRNQNELWTLSRRLFCPGAPRPMHSMNELQSWQLVLGHRCQFCGKRPVLKGVSLPSSVWSQGPGSGGIRSIWPFQIRSCGSCLLVRLVKVCTDSRPQPDD